MPDKDLLSEFNFFSDLTPEELDVVKYGDVPDPKSVIYFPNKSA